MIKIGGEDEIWAENHQEGDHDQICPKIMIISLLC